MLQAGTALVCALVLFGPLGTSHHTGFFLPEAVARSCCTAASLFGLPPSLALQAQAAL